MLPILSVYIMHGMPRGPRLDYPGALHHVIARGVERRRIFRSDHDRSRFVGCLVELVTSTGAALYAWALMPNHFLLRTGELPLSQLVHRWLTHYVRNFNLIHRRAGHLFQDRFKNTLLEEDSYLLELVRYIHLNPVRSQLPVTIESLDERCTWATEGSGRREAYGHRAVAVFPPVTGSPQASGRQPSSGRQGRASHCRDSPCSESGLRVST